MRKLVAFALVASVALAKKPGSSNCPSGLNCKDDRYYPHPQKQNYDGDAHDQNAIIYALLSNPNPSILGGVANVGLAFENGVYTVIGQYAIQELAKLETPFFIRGNTMVLAATWNSQTWFNNIQPVLYTTVPSFPFASQVSAALNTTLNRNIAQAYAIMRMSEYLTPKGVLCAQMLANPPYGIDITYREISNLNDPRDIGNIAAAATIAYAKADGYNSESEEFDIWKRPYSDISEMVPVNDVYELSSVARYQPLMETKDDGSFVGQVPVGAQIQDIEHGYAVTWSQLQSTYKVNNNQRMFSHDGSKDDPLTTSELALLKKEADIVLAASANLNDETKMIAQFFDSKILSFAYMPLNCLTDGTYTFIKTLGLDLAIHLGMMDAALVAWREKGRVDQIRPVSAIRYLYGNTKVNAYAGPNQGTQLIDGEDWNSFLRTMPHSDFPSGTSCMCMALAEVVENWRGTPGTVNLRWDFAPGSSIREPGVTPAFPGVTKSWASTASFIKDCAYSRVHAGVHFNETCTRTIDLCTGLGQGAFNKFKQAAKWIL